MSVVQATYGAWGRGELNGPDQAANIAKYIHENCFIDFSSPIHNSSIFKTYEGHAGFTEWMNNLTENEYIEFVPEFLLGPGGRIVVRQSYFAKNKTTGKCTSIKVTDYFEYTVQDGKILNGKVYMGNVAEMESIYSP